ncbi:MAG TPA: RHS repeat-associated core domain-containing protein [Nannocystaceae bacterium]|nr:RHS repeat-associated core domain-containing protein [Nannocystaceae bacterium]
MQRVLAMVVASSLALSGCRGPDDEADASAQDDLTPRVAPAPAVIATEVATLRAAPVVFDPSTAVGALPAEASVDARGQASYRIPIAPSPGVGAMTPSLALSYNSAGGNGIAGVGFTLEGQSAVRRCTRSLLRDGAWGPVRWDATDAVCLDGDRLVLETGTYGSDGSAYRPAHDPTQRVVLHGTLDGPVSWFEIFEGNGRIRQYGTPAAALWRASDIGELEPYVWALRSERDRFDNEIEYVYSHPLVLATGPAQLQLDEIRYAGTGSAASQRRIHLEYDNRPDLIDAWFFGAHTRMITRLASIEVEGPYEELVRRYELDYAVDDDDDNARSRVIAARVCDAADVCLPDTTFEWDPPPTEGWERYAFDLDEILEGLMQVEVQQLIGASRQVLITDGDGDLTQELMFGRDAERIEPWTVWNPQGEHGPGNPCPPGAPIGCEAPPELTDFYMPSPPLVADDLDDQIEIPSGLDDAEQAAFGLALRRYRPSLGPTVIAWNGDRRSDLLIPRNPTPYFGDPPLDADEQIYANGLYVGTGFDAQTGFALVDVEDGFDARIYNVITLDHDGDRASDAWLCRGQSYRDATWTLGLRSPDAPSGFDWHATDVGCSVHDEVAILPTSGGGQRLLVVPAYDDDGDPIDDDARVAYERLELDLASDTAGLFPVGLPRDRYQRWHDVRCRNGLAHTYSGLTVFSAGLGNDKLVDVNGDGLVDVLRFELAAGDTVAEQDDILQGLPIDGSDALPQDWAAAELCTADADDEQDAGIRLYTNTGEGFLAGPIVGELDGVAHASYWLNFVGAQLLDGDDDGLVDLALPSTGEDGEWTLLRSVGDGTFIEEPISLPAGWPAYTSNATWRDELDASRRARTLSLQVDRRSAGELLFVGQVGDAPSATWPTAVNLWHRSMSPALSVGRLRGVVDGLGHDVAFHYEGRDVSELEAESAEQAPVPGAMFVVSQLDEGATQWDPVAKTHAYAQRVTRYDYAGASIDRLGGGLLGFSDVIARVQGRGHTGTQVHTRYSHAFDAELHDWTQAGRPIERITARVIDGPQGGIEFDDNDDQLHLERESWTWTTTPTALAGGTTALTYGAAQRVRAYERKSADLSTADLFALVEGLTPYRDATRAETRDAFGSPMTSTTTTWLGETVTRTYEDVDHDTENWLLGRIGTMTTTSCSYAGACKMRTSASTYDATTGALASTTTEPGDPLLELQTDLVRDPQGNVITTSNSAGGVIRWSSTSYDAEGVLPESFTNQLGQTSYVIHHPASGALLAEVDVAGATERTTLDGFLRPTAMTVHSSPLGASDGAEASIEYLLPDPMEPLSAMRVREIDRSGQRTTTHVLPTGEPMLHVWRGMAPLVGVVPNEIAAGGEIEQRYAYDVFGHGTAVSVPKWVGAGGDTYWTETERDPAGNPLRTIAPDGTEVAKHTYSSFPAMVGSRRIDSTDAIGNVTSQLFDGDGALVQSADGSGVLTCFTVGAFGQLEQVRRNCGAKPGPAPKTSMAYDAYGRLLSESDPAFGTRTRTWNAFGDLEKLAYASGESTTFHYETLGRVDRTTDSEGTTWFTWDEARPGELAWTETPGDVVTSYEYDNWGRLYREHVTVPSLSGSDDYVFQYDWGAGPRLEQVHYPAVDGEPAFTAALRWDDPGYLRALFDPATGSPWWIGRTANASSQLELEDYNNGVTTTRAWNAKRGWLEHITTKKGATKLQDLEYGWTPAGELDHRVDTPPAPDVVQREAFLYDANRRLKQANPKRGDTKLPETKITYDTIGNIKTKSGVGAYAYDGDGVLVTADGKGAFHDLDGNVISHGSRTFTYTPFQKVESISDGAATQNIHYDANHNRVLRHDTASNTDTISIGNRYERVIAAGGATQSITYRVAVGDRVVAQFVRKPAPLGGWSTVATRLHDDHLGSTHVISDSAGAALNRISYDAWGQARKSTDWTAGVLDTTASAMGIGFTGHRAQVDAGLIDMRGRMYDPKIAQFMSADPVVADPRSGTSWNRYSYVENRPLVLTDPSGFSPAGGGDIGDTICEGFEGCKVDEDGNPHRLVIVRTSDFAPDNGAGAIGWRGGGGNNPWGFAESTSGADPMMLTRSQMDRMQKQNPNIQFIIVRSRLEAEALGSVYPPAPKKPWKNPFGNLLAFADAVETAAQVGLTVASFVNPVAAAAATILDLGDAAVAASNGDYTALGIGILGVVLPGHLPASKVDDAADLAKAATRTGGDDANRVWTATDDGRVLAPGMDVNAVPTAAPDPKNPVWGQVHSSHPHGGDPRAHAHGPEPGTGRRVDAPLADTMRRVDDGLRSGELRHRRNRGDRGGP